MCIDSCVSVTSASAMSSACSEQAVAAGSPLPVKRFQSNSARHASSGASGRLRKRASSLHIPRVTCV